jgi:hypothetical protein
LGAFDNRELSRILVPKIQDIATMEKLRNETFQNLYSALSITKKIKAKECDGQGMLHVHRSVTKSVVMRPLGRHWHRRKNSIKIYSKNRM